MRGSTLVPSRVTTSPSTSTSPSSISSSHLRREATPDCASSFCSRTRPSSSLRASLGAAHRGVLGRSSGGARGPVAGGGHRRGQVVLEVVHVGQVGRELGQLVERGDADPLEEVAGGAVEVRAVLAVLAGLLDQPAGQQRAHHAVDVDAADRRHPGARHRLLVGDHRQRLERGLGEPRLLALEHERLDDRGELLARVEAPAAGDVAQLEAAALLVVLAPPGSPARPRPRRPGGPTAEARRAVVERLVGDHQHRLERRAQLGDRHVEGRRCRSSVGLSASGCPPGRVGGPRSALGRRAVELVDLDLARRSPPVQRTVSSPSGVTWSKATAPSRNSSSSERKRATVVSVSGESPHSARKVIVPLRRSRSTTSWRLLADAHLRRRGCAGARPRAPAWAPSPWPPARRTASSPMPISTSGSSAGEPLLEPHRARVAPRLRRQPLLEDAGHLLERAVLQQPGEEQVARLEQREVLLVLHVALRQQPGRLEVEQGRGDHEERRGLLEVPDRRRAP